MYFLTGQRGEACRYEWLNRGCVCLSVRVGGGMTLRADLCVEEGEEEERRGWMDGYGEGTDN